MYLHLAIDEMYVLPPFCFNDSVGRHVTVSRPLPCFVRLGSRPSPGWNLVMVCWYCGLEAPSACIVALSFYYIRK
jgi:hypothetical protein